MATFFHSDICFGPDDQNPLKYRHIYIGFLKYRMKIFGSVRSDISEVYLEETPKAMFCGASVGIAVLR